MTDYQYKILLELNKQKFADCLDKLQLKKHHLQATLERDKLLVLNLPTADIDTFISNLELLIYDK